MRFSWRGPGNEGICKHALAGQPAQHDRGRGYPGLRSVLELLYSGTPSYMGKKPASVREQTVGTAGWPGNNCCVICWLAVQLRHSTICGSI